MKMQAKSYIQGALVFIMTALGGFSAHADDTEIFFGGVTSASVQPNILFILDTSGSMSNKDGGDSTRIDRMKDALRTLINSMNNVNVGLMRFNAPGGPVLFPVTDINQSLSDNSASSGFSGSDISQPASSSDDAEETSGGGVTLDNEEATLTHITIPGSTVTTNLTIPINKGSDDAEQSVFNGKVNLTDDRLDIPRNTDLHGSNRRRQRQYIGIRFENLTIPPGAIIESATIDFVIKERQFTRDASVNIFAEANDSGTFQNNDWNISSRSRTNTVITWDIDTNPRVGNTLSTPDIKAIFQELVNSNNWASGNAATIILNRDSTNNNRIVSSFEDDPAKAPVLNLSYSAPDPSSIDNQTVGIRFLDVEIPQGATITSATIEFTASTSSSGTAIFTIQGEDADNPSTYSNAANDISGRSYTTSSVSWTAEDWVNANDTYTTADVSSIVQEIVNRSGWCGGNAMAFKITGDALNEGSRIFDTYDKSATTSPKLRVTYDPDSVPPTGGCMATELNRQIAEDDDDAEQQGSSMSLGSSDLDMPDYVTGLRFQNLPLPQGAKILSAYLEFTADESNSDPLDLVIEGHNADNSGRFTNSNNNLTNRSRTSASVTWSSIPAWNTGNKYRSPNLAAIVQEIVDRSGWQNGNALSFIISDGGGSGERVAETFDSNPADSARLIIKAIGVDDSIAEETTRDALLELIDSFRAAGPTPITDTLYEAALYYKGQDVYYGKTRGWNGWSSNRRYFRISDDSTYTGGNVYTPSGCSESNYDDSDCINESITGSPKYISPITDACQSNHIVLLTDGQPTVNESEALIRTMTGKSSCYTESNPGDIPVPPGGIDIPSDGACAIDLAEFLSNNDQSDSLSNTQTIKTHTIGFNFSSNFLKHVADKGQGNYKEAGSASELVDSFNEILSEILQTDTTFVSPGVTVNSFNRLTHRNEIYYALFRPEEEPRWPGNLKRYRLKSNGDIVDQNDVAAIDPDTGFFKDTAKSYWSSSTDGNDLTKGGAARELPSYSSRKVYTYYAGSTTNTLSHPSNALSVANKSNITKAMLEIESASDAYHENLINWARGQDIKDADGDGIINENRYQLSDPLHSVPHLVTYGGTDSAPDITIFYGDNEGFIHAIDATDGSEIFSFIPEELLDNLKILYENTGENRHPYGMDGPVTSWVYDKNGDNQIDPAEDHVYVYFGMRRGGSSYYALDVTDRNSPKMLWSITGGSGDYAELGQSWSKPIKTKVRIENDLKDVLIFAGGYDEDQDDVTVRTPDDEGRAIFIVDAADGSLLWSAGPHNSDDLKLSDMKYSIPSDIRAIDVNSDGLTDQFYVGDMGGQIWRFDVHHGKAVDKLVTGAVIAEFADDTTAGNRRFYHEPDVSVFAKNGSKKLAIAIGSGYQAHPLNKDIDDRFYMFIQNDYLTAPADGSDLDTDPDYDKLTESDLYDATANLVELGTTAADRAAALTSLKAADGWFIRLTNDGEKVLASALTIGGEVLFVTYEPNSASSSSCVAAAGTPRFYQVHLADATPTRRHNIGDLDPNSLDRATILKTIGLPADPVRLRVSDTTTTGGTTTTTTKDVICIGTECELHGTGLNIEKTYWYSN